MPAVIVALHAHLPWVVGTREERWLHEAVLDCYLPLLDVLERAPQGRLTMSVTGVLVAMLKDRGAWQRTREFIARAAKTATSDWHREAAERALEHRGSIVDRLAELGHRGKVELVASGLTHGFLPLLMMVPEAARAQIELGVEAHRRAFGAEPLGFWLPECGYAPGLDAELARVGVRYTFVDSHALAGTVHGTASAVFLPGGVAAFGRDVSASEQVWSSKIGYPGDPDYADFHHRVNGERVLAVTGSEPKRRWDPDVAATRAREHAAHFIDSRAKGAALQVAPYDAELFGHWWLEGPAFLEAVLQSPLLTTPSRWLAQHPTLETRELPFSTWGRAGTAEVWLGPQNAWMWPHLHRASEERPKSAEALSELLLAQASDWPFLIDAKTSAGFAQEQFEQHLLAFRALQRGEQVTVAKPFPWLRLNGLR